MANPSADFPGAVHTPTDTSGNDNIPLGETTPKHSDVHGKIESELVATQTKIGHGTSTPSSGKVLTGTGPGTSAWLTPSGGGGAGTGEQIIAEISQVAHGLAVGDVVRFDGADFVKAKADTPATAYVYGVVSDVTDADNFTVTTSGLIGGLSGLTAGAAYFLSGATAGALTRTPPLSNDTVVKPVLFATSTTEGIVNIMRGRVNVVARTYARLGINYGLKSSYDLVKIHAELAYLGRYVRKLRIAIPSWDDTTGITNMRALALLAKSYGFETTYGVTAAGTGHDLTYYNNWKSQVTTEAAWASANGIDEFYIGNEEDWWAEIGGITGVTQSGVQDDVLSMATTLKAAYPDMRIVYSSAEGTALGWDSHGTGDLDALGMNIYNSDWNGTVDYFLTLAFGAKMFISEFNLNTPFPASALTDDEYRDYIAAQIKHLKSIGTLMAYFFTFDWGGDYGTSDDWGLSNGDGTYKPGIEQLFSIPR